jgi:hypothetical protein
MYSFQDDMSDIEADQLPPPQLLRRCSSAICLTEKKGEMIVVRIVCFLVHCYL